MTTPGSAVFGESASAPEVLQLIPLQGLLDAGWLRLAILFFVLAIVAAVVGAQGVAGISMSVAKWFIIIFVILAVVTAVI